jgi:fructose transport system ATP-binding protein
VAFSTRIVVMDEPTAALGVREGGAVLEMISEIKASGLAVIVISHNMQDVFKIADRITVMRLGQAVTTVRREDSSLTEIVGYMTGAHGRAEAMPPISAERERAV